MCFERFLVDARLVIEPFAVTDRRQLDQVLKPTAVHRQQREMGAGFLHAGRFFVATVARRDVSFQAENGVDVVGFAGRVEIDGPEKVSVIGNRQRRHALLFGLLDQIGNAVGPVEQAEVCVAVQMRKRTRIRHGLPLSLCRSIRNGAAVVEMKSDGVMNAAGGDNTTRG